MKNNIGKCWSKDEEIILINLIRKDMSYVDIAEVLGRSRYAIESRAVKILSPVIPYCIRMVRDEDLISNIYYKK